MHSQTKIYKLITAERQRQEEKWGVQDLPLRCPEYSETFYKMAAEKVRARERRLTAEGRRKEISWDMVLLEECYEALAETDLSLMKIELVQALAVGVAMYEAIDRMIARRIG